MLIKTAFERVLNVCKYILKNILSCIYKQFRSMACSEQLSYLFYRQILDKRSVLCFEFELKLMFSVP